MLLTFVPLGIFLFDGLVLFLAIIGVGLTVFGIIEIVKKTKKRNFIPIVLAIVFVIVGIASIVSAITMLPTAIEMTNEMADFIVDILL